MKKILLFIILTLLCVSICYAEEDFSLTDLHLQPTFQVKTPEGKSSYSNGGKLLVECVSSNVKSYIVRLDIGEKTIEEQQNGSNFKKEFTFHPTTQRIKLSITGFKNENFSGEKSEQTIFVVSPKEELIEKMIDLAYANSKDKNYNFAPAEKDHHIGVCKNFVMRLFDTFSKNYSMEAYPTLKLHMPKNRSLKDSKPYQYGLEWRIERAEDGSPFEIVEQFKYDSSLSKEENYKKAYNLMTNVKKGDFFQMVGNYGGGNGPHSLFFIEDFDPNTEMLHWTDSNMFGKRINGERWGYMQFDATKSAEWFANVFNMKDRGATLYRLRDDLIKQ